MFKSLKDKLKGAIGKFSKKVEEEGEVEETIEEKTEEVVEEVPEKKQTADSKAVSEAEDDSKEEPDKSEAGETEGDGKEPEGSDKDVSIAEGDSEEKKDSSVEKEADSKKEKKGFFRKVKEKVTTVELSEDKFEDIFWELEVTLLENNVALEVIEKIKDNLREELTKKRVGRGSVEDVITEALEESIGSLFIETEDLVEKIKEHEKPCKVAFIGINGSGKTTSMAKVAKKLQDEDLSVIFAASDTFRAASMEQLGEHADNLGIRMIKHDYKSDPSAVSYDAISHAKSKGIDVVLIDTAGRLHSNKNLMEELKKLVRVNEPHFKVFVGESTTGNDCVEQAKQFDEAVGVDGIILTKTDVDDKGGAAISISHVTGKPIYYIGTGQEYKDLEKFDSERIMKELF